MQGVDRRGTFMGAYREIDVIVYIERKMLFYLLFTKAHPTINPKIKLSHRTSTRLTYHGTQ